MKRRELLELIEEGESINCEFKRKFSTSEKIAKEMIAFANTKGGYLLFGVDDNKDIIGVESEKSEAGLIADAAANFCEPHVKYVIDYMEVDGKELVIVEVPESDEKPHRVQDYLNKFDINKAVVMIRVNDKSVQASKEMVRIMRAQAGNLRLKNYSIGPNEKNVFEYLNKNEKISVKELSSLINISERRASRTLVKLVRANLLMIHTKDNGEEYFTAA
ncbi:MAG TPA: ATP-binding protein [Ignavibacteriaceae bacterium]|nr:ATP-binding protein [Ignavibacteriaceae bacterium]